MLYICRFATIPNISKTNVEIHPPVTTLPMHAKRNVAHRVTPNSELVCGGGEQICIRTFAIK